ncbi:type II toxin-antitoxin system RelE/ParE family toxin [Sphingomonas sp. dw_22]|uniref:type II toxin-antitoxin system RelE/ParE family toxin n=1 Tax=Sphingomonas sp. dw_22 TaxID=2721175 RepID=UPI001BD31C02|nr:type II toxin-antitoxin system RelE/ParE family toxin [Sphingomonas sp. dw_22]
MTAPFAVFLTAGAEADLADIHGWIAGHRGTDQAEAFLDHMLARVESLERFPNCGSVPAELDTLGIREFRQMGEQPYRLIYRVFGDHVFVLLIADGRRDFRSLIERRLLG